MEGPGEKYDTIRTILRKYETLKFAQVVDHLEVWEDEVRDNENKEPESSIRRTAKTAMMNEKSGAASGGKETRRCHF